MKKLLFALSLLFSAYAYTEDDLPSIEETWANWSKRFDRAYEGIRPHKMPGRAMGIMVPNEMRQDLLPLAAFGYETLSNERFGTVLFLLPAPASVGTQSGLFMPDLNEIETSAGDFVVDTALANELIDATLGVKFDSSLFLPRASGLLETQLMALKYVLRGRSTRLKVLPVYVRLPDVNSQTKDLAPVIADKIKDLEQDADIMIVMAANLSRTKSAEQLIQADSTLLKAIRELDSDATLATDLNTLDADVITLGLLTLKWLGAEHGQILAYCNSPQLILTKDKSLLEGYTAAAFASMPKPTPKLPHFDREKMVDTFGELLRTDILTLARQTVNSTVDPTAAKPPSLIDKQASRKWPVYVSLYDSEGKLAGQAGTHQPVGPLEESLRRFTVEATQKAKPGISKSTMQSYVVDVSIPYGFLNINDPEDLVPYLNGVIVHRANKSSAMHPDGWRKYPDPHQLLGVICFGLGMKPWAYATAEAKMDSFRVLSFNEKEPFQDLGAATRKKKKKTEPGEDFGDDGGGGGDLGGGLPF